MGEALLLGGAGVGIADKLSRTMGNKDGIVKPVYEKAKGKLSGKDTKTDQQTMDSSSNDDHSKPSNSSKSQQNDSVQHDTPPNSNYTDSVSKNTERGNFVCLYC